MKAVIVLKSAESREKQREYIESTEEYLTAVKRLACFENQGYDKELQAHLLLSAREVKGNGSAILVSFIPLGVKQE